MKCAVLYYSQLLQMSKLGQIICKISNKFRREQDIGRERNSEQATDKCHQMSLNGTQMYSAECYLGVELMLKEA